MSALEEQVGGNHYRHLHIQPVEFIHANGIGFFEGNVINVCDQMETKGRGEGFGQGKTLHRAID